MYKKAKNIAAISEISKEPPRKIIEIANKNPNNQASLENAAKAAKAIPKNKDEVEEKNSRTKK